MSRIRAWRDAPLGWAVARLGSVAISSFPAYAALVHGPWLSPRGRERLGALRARAAFLHARRTVPAYRAFLEEHDALDASHFEDLPIMSKDRYVRRYPLEATLLHGRLPRRGVVLDESSGSTGTPTMWARGHVERKATRRLIQFASHATLGTDDYILINAFALGPWATGMMISMSMVATTVVKSVGPDVDKILTTLEQLGPDRHYVIAGYPPFLKVLADCGLDWSRYRVSVVVGGEGMSEELREHLEGAFDAVTSSFGASDLEINLAVESPWTQAVRRTLRQHPALVERLTGRSDHLPMVFQYDPTQVFVENGPEDRLLFTLCRLENLSPRIRYDLGDHGRVLPWATVAAACAAEGIALPDARTRLPVLLHWGRQEHAVAFFGCKVTPEHVQAALLRVPALAEGVMHHGLRVFEDAHADKRLEVIMELRAGVEAPPDAEAAFFDALGALNQDFRESRRMLPPHLGPALTLEPFGQSRLSHQDARIKRTYLVDAARA